MTDKNSVRFVPWKPNIETINLLYQVCKTI